MFLFSLEKALGLLVMPIGLLWLLLLAGALTCRLRRQRSAAALFLAIAGLYACAGNYQLAGALSASLERRYPPVRVEALEPFEVVFVLGGGCEEDPAGQPELSVSGDRVFLAARLWHAGKAGLLVASGFSYQGLSGARDGGQGTLALWRSVGVPDRAMLAVAEPCWNTRDEIRAYVRLQARFGWRRMALVSSATHLARAMALASREGLEVTPLGSDWRGRPVPFMLQDLVPQAAGFEGMQRACWEYLGRWLGR